MFHEIGIIMPDEIFYVHVHLHDEQYIHKIHKTLNLFFCKKCYRHRNSAKNRFKNHDFPNLEAKIE